MPDNPEARLVLIRVDSPDYNTNLDIKPGLFDAPAWSPAGDGIALATQNEAGEAELVLAGEDGKVKQVLASLSGPVTFAWSPKGIHLAYTVYDASGTRSDDPPGGAGQQPARACHSSCPGGCGGVLLVTGWPEDRLFYRRSRGVLRQIRPDGGTDLCERGPGRLGLRPGQRNHKKVATFTPTDAFQQIFPYYSQYQRSDTIWSPDSQALVLSTVDPGGGNAIYTVGADGGHLQKIAEGELAFWAWK